MVKKEKLNLIKKRKKKKGRKREASLTTCCVLRMLRNTIDYHEKQPLMPSTIIKFKF